MELRVEQRDELESVILVGYDGSVSARAAMVLAVGDGEPVARVAARMGTTRQTVYAWVRRFTEEGMAGLVDRVPTGRPRSVDGRTRARILAISRATPPEQTGLTHWSSRELARYLKAHEGIAVSHDFIAQLWAEHGLKPHRQSTFKVPTDPQFAAKTADIVGLYLDPPDGAVILSVDEKSQCQALERTQPLLPMTFHKSEKRTHDYVRHGTTNLFAALEVLTGQVHARCYPRRRAEEFISFMTDVVRRYPPGQQIHVICDNLNTHKGPEMAEWLAKHPNVTMHYTPVGCSWQNQIETWFGIITRHAIRRGSFASLAQLIKRIKTYVDTWNETAEPFTWTATADDIIEKVAILSRDYKKLIANNA